MKLIYFIEDITESGGVERAVIQKANALHGIYGYDVTIVSVYSSTGEPRYRIDEGVGLISLGMSRIGKDRSVIVQMVERTRLMFRVVRKVNRLHMELRADVICFIWVIGAMALPFCRTNAVKIFESHSSRSNTPYKLFLWLMEKCADAVVCLTDGDSKEYKVVERVRVIPNFVMIQERITECYEARKVIAVGRLVEIKGFERLVRIWKRVAARHRDWTLDIYGVGEKEQELRMQIAESGLDGSVFLRGYTDDIMREYMTHSIHVMTSYAEGQPMTLLEAQSCGLPSVTFDFDYGARDVVENGVNGFIVEQNDEEAFAVSLEKMMDSETLRQQMGHKAREKAEEYRKERIMPMWHSLFREMLSLKK